MKIAVEDDSILLTFVVAVVFSDFSTESWFLDKLSNRLRLNQVRKYRYVYFSGYRPPELVVVYESTDD